MQNNKFDRSSVLKEKASELRKNMTRHERHLWYDFLRSYKRQWRRQQIINSFIVDFYCPKAMLAVELDGSQHYDEGNMLYDERRTQKINKYNIVILRFSNIEIDRRFKEVCETIDLITEQRIKELSGQK